MNGREDRFDNIGERLYWCIAKLDHFVKNRAKTVNTEVLTMLIENKNLLEDSRDLIKAIASINFEVSE